MREPWGIGAMSSVMKQRRAERAAQGGVAVDEEEDDELEATTPRRPPWCWRKICANSNALRVLARQFRADLDVGKRRAARSAHL